MRSERVAGSVPAGSRRPPRGTPETLPEENVRLLRMVDIFEPLSPEEIRAIEWKHLSTTVEPGEVFYTPMDLSQTLFVIQRGRVRLYRATPEGRQLTYAVLEEGTVFGEMTLTAQRLRNSYAEAMEVTEVSAMCRADMERLIMSKPAVGLRLVYLLSERLNAYETRMEGLAFKEVPARLADLILQLVEQQGLRNSDGYRIPTRYTHQQLGSMIGANREAVTRAFARLREAGVVETRRRYIHVGDIELLRRATEDSFFG